MIMEREPVTADKKYTSVADRLRDLGPVFSIQDMRIHFNISSEQASLYMKRWSERGHIQKFAPGVSFNTLFFPEAPDQKIGLALTKVLRRPFVMIGGSSLYHSGWTTQVHHQMEIAVPIMRGKTSLPKIEGGIRLIPRSVTTFNKLNAQINAGASGGENIPVVMPAYALADAYLKGMEGKPENDGLLTPADEIDKDYLDESQVDAFADALRDLGATEDVIDDALEEYGSALNPESDDEPMGYF